LVGVAVNVTLLPEQIDVDDALMETDGVTELVDMVTTLLVAVGVAVQLALEVIVTLTWSPLASVVDTNVGELEPAVTPLIFHWYVGVLPPLVGVAVNVTLPPEQIDVDEALIETEGVTEVVVIVTTLLVAVAVAAQLAFDVMITLTWSPFARLVVVNVVELVPALAPFICHWYVGVLPPLVGVAANVTLLPEQIDVDDALIKTEGVTELVVIVTTLLVAVGVVVQLAFEVMSTLTWSPFASVLDVNVAAFVPAFTPFICHWYVGVLPPFVGVAVNVTLFPAQIDVDDALIETDGVTELVVMVITLLVAVAVVAQLALEVMMRLTWSPLASVLDVKVAELVPAFTPFIAHWYVGAAPPLVGVAVKVMGFPEQIVVVVAVMATDGVTEFTVRMPVAVFVHGPKL
jgi:hypothetical protein